MDDEIFTSEQTLQRLGTEWLPSWLRTRRWFGGKDRPILECRLIQTAKLGPAWICAVEVHFAEASPETYLVPLMQVPSAEAGAVVAAINGAVLVDATHVPEFRAALFRVLAGWDHVPGIAAEQGARFRSLYPAGSEVPPSRILSIEQSNTSLIFGERVFLKWFRKLERGANPDVEMLRFLGERAGFTEAPGFFGALQWQGGSLAVATEFFPESSDAWAVAMSYYKRRGDFGVAEQWRELARRLGESTGRLHVALAKDDKDPDFSPEPVTRDDLESIIRSMLVTARDAISELPEEGLAVPEWMQRDFFEALDGMRPVQRLVETVQALPLEGVKLRIHGDYHLGQVLRTADGFKITDFEGEPLRNLAERRAKQPPVRDVAGMLRSLGYVAASQCGERNPGSAESTGDQRAFLEGWRSAVSGSPLASEQLLPIFLLQKAFYELRYELRHRPDWVHIPMGDLIGLCRSIP